MSATPGRPKQATSVGATSARFVSGSLLRHVIVMASTGAVGLVAVFAVDLINLFYISRLGEREIAAAVGFAGVVSFFHLSLCIGLMIGLTAIVSRKIGAQERDEARCIATSGLVLMAALTMIVGSGTALFLGPIVQALGATGETARLARGYLAITVHSLPLMGIGMGCSALLRAVGDAKRSMNVTLGAAVVTAVLDPVFIFGLDLGLTGAAMVVWLARCMMVTVALHSVLRHHRLLSRFNRSLLLPHTKLLASVAGPAVLTNLATPVAAAFVTHSIASFGPSATAGQATIDRVTPVAFGLIYSLSGAVGPILAQNLGAREYGRVRQGLRTSLLFMVVAVASAWLVLALCQGLLVQAFSLEGPAAQMVHAFCSWLAASFFFAGALFVANAAFNNLGRPLWSTGFNWARATVGTIPFVWWGAQYGPVGVLASQAVGTAIFGIGALWMAFRLTDQLSKRAA
ncbi:MAG: polysaccharide biosynthesis C-terminal domain-containing protein [Betaproteobacteria bacterium]|jgi:putative MATE family efflux protein|nr:polysaccharide biosynthesis C-terminal domain-containing protein [Betaproteobacteria bacterium]MBP6646267.1 polysaccharide biosynthesis C-terminal domain-containing protein [Burkholderiaceae bacterium]